MMIIGCDFHPSFGKIAFVNKETGEYGERRLTHPEEAAKFYRSLAGSQVRVGMEATGNFRWFRRLLGELDKRIRPLDEAVKKAVEADAGARLLMTHPGVGPVVSLAHKLAIRLYWMLRSGEDYRQVMERGSHAGQSVCPAWWLRLNAEDLIGRPVFLDV